MAVTNSPDTHRTHGSNQVPQHPPTPKAITKSFAAPTATKPKPKPIFKTKTAATKPKPKPMDFLEKRVEESDNRDSNKKKRRQG
jgi:hypothetical protein